MGWVRWGSGGNCRVDRERLERRTAAGPTQPLDRFELGIASMLDEFHSQDGSLERNVERRPSLWMY